MISREESMTSREGNMTSEKYGRLKRCLFCGTAAYLTAFSGVTANAQNAEEDGEIEVLEQIVVTGSHIRRNGFDEKTPIQVLDREALKVVGATSVVDVARNLAINVGSELVNDDGALTGSNQFNLRGLGLSSTLTLINGRRGGTSTVADGSGYQFFDVNSVPLAAIRRLEVLTDGASATYGSEAVAGVVNIITRKGMDGAEFTAQHNNAVNNQTVYGFALGGSSDRGAFGIYGNYYTQTGAQRTDFEFIRTRLNTEDPALNAFASGRGSPGTYFLADVDNSGTGLPVITTRDGAQSYADVDCVAAGGLDRDDGRCRLDFSEQRGELTEEDRYQIFAEADYELTDRITTFVEVSFSRNEIQRYQDSSINHANGAVEGGLKYIPGDHPFNFWIEDPDDPTAMIYRGPTIDANGNATWSGNDEELWATGALQAADIASIHRPLGIADGYPGTFQPVQIDHEFFRAVVGFDVTLPYDWNLNMSWMQSINTRSVVNPWSFLAEAYDGVNPDNPSAIGLGIWNPFGTRVASPDLISPKDGVSTAGNTYEDLEYFRIPSVSSAKSEQKVFDAIFSGDLMDLPSGLPISAAFGFQYRSDELSRRSDPFDLRGLARGFGVPPNLDVSFETLSGFGEVLVPLSDNFEIQLSMRHEDFGDSGSTTDPKISARWQATDTLGLRASYGTSFQNPTVFQKGRSQEATIVSDTCKDGANFSITATTEGDENLMPQSSTNINLGVIYQPTRRANFSVDVWQYDYTDLIVGGQSPQAIVDANAANGCGDDPSVLRDASGQILGTLTSASNAGSVLAQGLDFAFSYSFDFIGNSDLQLRSNFTYVNKFEVEQADGTIVDRAGNRNAAVAGFRAMPKLRGNISALWSLDNHSATATVRYVDSVTNDIASQAVNVPKIASWTTFDLQYTYTFEGVLGTDTTAFTFGVLNIFDKDPSDIGGRPGYERTLHDPRGRQLLASVTIGF